MKARIAITCGDPAGVGPEIIEKLVRSYRNEAAELSIIGPRHWLNTLGDSPSVSLIETETDLPVCKLGSPNELGAKVALEAMELAANGCLEGRFDAVATGPIAKEWVYRVGYAFPGQTEFFASKWGGRPSMGFVGEHLNVVLATWHVPLSKVPESLDVESLRFAVKRAHGLGELLGFKTPRIGVCGLNPHAGERGVLGSEERDWMNGCLEDLREEVPGVSLCLPGDTVFRRAMLGDFDVVVAAYHDQGLAPLKTIDFETAVNVTLGLPFVRTSPDHGTGFDIAGRGVASSESFRRAVDLAITFAERMRESA